MRTSSAVAQSNQNRSPPSPARQWATRLVLFVACAASVATSYAEPYLSMEHQGTPLTLKTNAPPPSLRLRVRLSTEKPIEHSLNLFMQGTIGATWKPDSPTSASRPGLRARLVTTPDSGSSPAWSLTSGFQNPDGTPAEEIALYPSTGTITDCKSKRECVWHIELQFEVDPRGAEGTIAVKPHFAGNVDFMDAKEAPAGASLEVTEE